MADMSELEFRVRKRLHDDFTFYAPRCLAVISKPDEMGRTAIKKFDLNDAQILAHSLMEKQKEETGKVRAIILKGRQQGMSTYTEGRFYHKTSMNPAQNTFILTHSDSATQNLLGMVRRFHDNCPIQVRPHLGRSNSDTLEFDRIDSSYRVSTAGAKGVGRSLMLTNLHGSEVAFWQNGEEHLEGLFQAVPDAPGTEIILESTALGMDKVFWPMWRNAVQGIGDFIPIFIPWFIQREYRRYVPEGFELNDDKDAVPAGEMTEVEYQQTFKLGLDQMAWRRAKIIELGGGERGFYKFKQEYPATPDEAFQQSGVGSFLDRRSVIRARKSDVATAGNLVIGVDPAGYQANSDRSVILRRRTRKIFPPEICGGLTTQQLARRIHAIIKAEKPARVFIDVGGLGIGVYDALMELPGSHGIVVPVNFGEAAYDNERFANRKAEMAWALKDWLEDPGGANIPDDDAVQSDFLANVADEPDRLQRERLKDKKWLRKTYGASTDIFDAAILTFAEPVRLDSGMQGNANTDFDPFNAFEVGQSYSGVVEFDPLV
jgi:hypothetical protein